MKRMNPWFLGSTGRFLVSICAIFLAFSSGCTPTMKTIIHPQYDSFGLRNVLVVVYAEDDKDKDPVTSILIKKLRSKKYVPTTDIEKNPSDGGVPLQGVLLAYVHNTRGPHTLVSGGTVTAMASFEPKIALLDLRTGEKASESKKACGFMQLDCSLGRQRVKTWSGTLQPTWQTPYYTQVGHYYYSESEEVFMNRIIDIAFENLPDCSAGGTAAVAPQRYIGSLAVLLGDHYFGRPTAIALAKLGKPAVDYLIGVVQEAKNIDRSNHWKVVCAVFALGETGDPRAVGVLENLKYHKQTSRLLDEEIKKALEKIRTKDQK